MQILTHTFNPRTYRVLGLTYDTARTILRVDLLCMREVAS
jgi:hypothetical protein